MRFIYFLVFLILLPFATLAEHPNPIPREQPMARPNTVVRTHANETKYLHGLKAGERTVDFPTQIIRMKGNVESLNLNCDQVIAAIDEQLLSHIVDDLFMYNSLTFCQYGDEETHKAIAFEINTYFDPISDKAIEYTTNFLKEYNGADLLGEKIKIESATGLVISLQATAGTKKKPDSPPFVVFLQDHNDVYFKSNYDMAVQLITDIYDNFYSNDRAIALPFYDRWFSGKSAYFAAVLKDSNYVELFPDRIFIMNQGEDIFVSNLSYYFAQDCNRYPSRRCL